MEGALKAEGLPPLEWYDVLLELERGGPMRPRDLQAHLLLAQYNLSRLLDRIEAAGLVERRPCPDDAPSDLRDIPSNYRFFSGGGGSVRGYRYQTIGPRTPPFGFVVGGRSLFEANVEARVKVTDTIGIVPFFDIGGAYAGSIPDFTRGDTRMSAGLGLRYYTGIGPIRLDVAFPLNPRPGDQPVVLYVSIGQSF